MAGFIATGRRYTRLAVVAMAVVVPMLVAQEAGASCRIVTDRAILKGVTVAAPGQTFNLDLAGVPMALEFEGASNPTAKVEVLAPLHFVASVAADKLTYRIKKDVDLYGGRIRLGRQAGHTWLGVQGDGVGLSLKPSLGLDVRAPLIVPCKSIELADGTPYATPMALLPPKARTLAAGAAFFPLYLGPREEAQEVPLEIRYAGPLQVLQRRRGWVQLEARWQDGSRIRGWTREEFAAAEAQEPEGWGEGRSAEAGCGRSDRPLLVQARLRKDAAIASSPGGTQWATVTRAIVVQAFPIERPDDWVQVASVPGLLDKPCSEHEHIWVRARDLVGRIPGRRP